MPYISSGVQNLTLIWTLQFVSYISSWTESLCFSVAYVVIMTCTLQSMCAALSESKLQNMKYWNTTWASTARNVLNLLQICQLNLFVACSVTFYYWIIFYKIISTFSQVMWHGTVSHSLRDHTLLNNVLKIRFLRKLSFSTIIFHIVLISIYYNKYITLFDQINYQ